MFIFYVFCHSFSFNPGPNLKKIKAHVKIQENMFRQYLEKRDSKCDRVQLIARTKEKHQTALFASSWLRNFII